DFTRRFLLACSLKEMRAIKVLEKNNNRQPGLEVKVICPVLNAAQSKAKAQKVLPKIKKTHLKLLTFAKA
ncbi:MAG: hypothetical protein IJS50_00155, partial [Desulfovibrio sp.]|nr:hypothetical protein [Desulfovibrio sp.]